MKFPVWMNERSLGAGLAAALVVAGCADPAPEKYVAPPAGSNWTLQVRDSGSFGSANIQSRITAGEGTWQGRRMLALIGEQQTLLVDPATGCWVATVRGAAPLTSWEPPLCLRWPLKAGEQWSSSHTITNYQPRKQTIKYDARRKVEAYESVSVPAGSIKAFKVSYSDTAGIERTDWFSPEHGIIVKSQVRRSGSSKAGPGTRDTELVSHTIKR